MLAFAASAQDAREVAQPGMPPACAELAADDGADPAHRDDTARIQAAIDACPARRAVRLVPGARGGVFVARPLALKPGVTLWIGRNATLYASNDSRAYDRGKGLCGTLDVHGGACVAFITVKGGEGGGIVGEGTIDGRGGEAMLGREETWWQLSRRAQRERLHQNVPRLVQIDGARDFTLYGIRLRNSPNFHVVLDHVDGFTAWAVKIDAPSDSRNTDGIDPMSSRNVTVAHSFIRTGDDGVAIKAGRGGPSENISIVDSHFYNGHGVSIGSETVGGVRNVKVERITMEGATSGLRIKSDISRGGLVRDVSYSDVCLRNIGKPIDISTQYDPAARGNSVPIYSGISFDRIEVEVGDAAPSKQCDGRFVSFPEDIAAKRPQLDDQAARGYSQKDVLAGWDPTVAAVAPDEFNYMVDATGQSGRFTTIQAAVNDAVARVDSSHATGHVTIHVKPGVYPELLYVPRSSASIGIHGEGSDPSAVRIVATLDAALPGARYAGRFGAQFAGAPHTVTAMFDALKDRATIGTPGSAVAWIRNDGFEASNVTFANGYNKEQGDAVGGSTVQSQAVAMMVDDADRVRFENVRFEGFQDTLYLHSTSPLRPARAFIHHSYVEGDMDFIFGEGTAYFLDTEIRSLGDRRVQYVLAPSTHYQSRFGFVFSRCAFTNDGSPNARAGTFKLARQWFRGQRCTPYAAASGAPGYACTLGDTDTPANPRGTVSRSALEAVGKVAILDSTIGEHIDKARPWADWNARGTRQHRPVQLDSDAWWDNLVAAGIDPVRELGLAARKSPAEPYLVEYQNH
jgi:pectin methylesterase-like acyl-CoA thioesterase